MIVVHTFLDFRTIFLCYARPLKYGPLCQPYNHTHCKVGETFKFVTAMFKLDLLQVPSAITHVLFWQRYFYKVHQLEQVNMVTLNTQPWDLPTHTLDFFG